MTNSIAILDPAAALATDAGWDDQVKQWKSILATGILPEYVKTPDMAIALAMRGRDFGWSPIESCMKMCIIKGKVTMYAETLSGMMLAHANAHDEVYEPVERGRERAAIKVRRKSMTEPFVFEYTIEDAKEAGLANQQNYKKHIRAMLWARVVSVVSRSAFSDVTGGAYVFSELTGDSGGFTTIEQVERADEAPLAAVVSQVEPEPAPTVEECAHLEEKLGGLEIEVAARFTDANIGRAQNMIAKRSGLETIDTDNPEHLRALIGAAAALLADAPPADALPKAPF